jgi:hypothetical protein
MTTISKPQTAVFRGKAQYAKVLGEPMLNYNKDGKEWKIDVVFADEKGIKAEAKKLGIADRVKQKDDYVDGQPYMTFKQAEFKRNGEANERVKVTDILGNPWPQDKLIGNGSDIDVKFVVVDYGPGKKHGIYIRSIRVLKLVEYNKKEFDDLPEDDEFAAEAKALAEQRAREDAEFKKDFDLVEPEAEAPIVADDLDDDLEEVL